MELTEIIFRISIIVVPAFFSIVLAAFWFFYKMNIASERSRIDSIHKNCEKLEQQYNELQIELTSLKAQTVTQPQVEDCIDKRFSQLEKEMLLRFDNLEKLILQIKTIKH